MLSKDPFNIQDQFMSLYGLLKSASRPRLAPLPPWPYCDGLETPLLIRSSKYVLGVRSEVNPLAWPRLTLRLLLESFVEICAVDGLPFGESGGLMSMLLAPEPAYVADCGLSFEVRSPTPPIVVVADGIVLAA